MAKKRSVRTKRKEYVMVDVIPPSCPKCGSTEREPYRDIVKREIVGEHNGIQYTRVCWKRTDCKVCGQSRIDRVFESQEGLPAK